MALVSFAVTGTLLIILPGPDTAVVLRSIAAGGRPAGSRSAIGICCGLAVWLVLAVAGISALLAASTVGYDALKVAGAVYLAWLGVRALMRRSHAAALDTAEDAGSRAASRWFLSGLATDLLNPKIGVLFITLLPQFVPHGAPSTPLILLFGVLYTLGTLAWYALLVFFAERVGAVLKRPRVRRRLQQVTGVALIGFALDLAFEAR